MALYWINGRVVDDQQEEVPWEYTNWDPATGWEMALPAGAYQLPTYTLPYQFGTPESGTSVQWQGSLGGGTPAGVQYTAPGYIDQILQWAERADRGELLDYEQEQWNELTAQARAVPLRDASQLYASYTAREDDPQGANWLGFGSPDLGHFLLETRDKIAQGTASPQERQTFDEIARMGRDWNYRATVPQASDVAFGLGDQFTQALAIFGLAAGGAGALGAFAPAAGAGVAAGSAAAAPSVFGIPTSTLSTIGALSSYGGTGASVLGQATGQPWLQRIGMGLGVLGGLAGGAAGIGNVLGTGGTGVQSFADAARLAQSVGRVGGALGTATGSDALRQASRYLGLAGRLGGTVGGFFDTGPGAEAPAEQMAPIASAPAGGGMEFDYSWDYGGDTPYDNWSWDAGAMSPDFFQSDAYKAFTGWGDPSGPGSSGDPLFSGAGGGGLLSTLGSLAGGLGGLLGRNASWLGPAVSGLTGLGTGAIGASAASDAARLQSQALNRAIDLQTAQWLAQQERTAPWVQAGQQALGQLQGLAGQGQPMLGQLGPISGASYGLPSATPGWGVRAYQGPPPIDAAAYRYTPGQGPRAADYRYTPGAVPETSLYRPGAVPTLSGAELLANDPGYQFRQDEARRALEASAAARGGLVSGATLSALQRQSQDLASQEYMSAWQRASQQAQLREQWGQAASQINWGQQLQQAQTREDWNRLAQQLGFQQAQTEAQFREQQAVLASTQNFQQALQGQQTAWQQGMTWEQNLQQQMQRWNEQHYANQLQQNQLLYGRDWQQREVEYQRLVDQYNAQRQAQQTAWNQYAGLAGYGPTAISQLGTQGAAYGQQAGNLLGQLGSAQALGQLGPANAWAQGLGALTSNINSAVQSNQAATLLSTLRGLNA